MNRTPSSRPSPPVGEKVPGGRLRGIPTGSWLQLTSYFGRCSLSMNLKVVCLQSNDLRKPGSWPQLTSEFWRCSLSMNRPLTPSLSPSDGERVAEGRVRGGSWSQCVRKSESGLSLNRAPSPHPSPPMGERVAEGRVRGQIHGSGVDAARSRYFLFSCCPVARHHNPRQPLRVSSLSIRTRSL